MPTLGQQLVELLRAPACVVGVGDPARGDDALGVRLAERLSKRLAGRAAEGAAGLAESARPVCWCDPCEGNDETGPRAAGASQNPGSWQSASVMQTGRAGPLAILLAEAAPERHLGWLAQGFFKTVLFLDAVDFGEPPGAAVLLDSDAMRSRLPQVSTHRLSLGLMARYIAMEGQARAWLLGVQPASLRSGQGLSETVERTLTCLEALLVTAAKTACRARDAGAEPLAMAREGLT